MVKQTNKVVGKLLFVTLSVFLFCDSYAQSLDDVLRRTLEMNPDLLIKESASYQEKSNLRESIAGYLPTLNIAAAYGREKMRIAPLELIQVVL